jgi:hypothetical protein
MEQVKVEHRFLSRLFFMDNPSVVQSEQVRFQ